jgi:hypothetical protein
MSNNQFHTLLTYTVWDIIEAYKKVTECNFKDYNNPHVSNF